MAISAARKTAGLFALLFILLFVMVGPVLAEEPDMEYVGLEGYGVYALAVTPEGQVLVGTSSGAWQTAADGRSVSQMSGAGMPVAGCSETGAPSDGSELCFVPSLAVNSRGDVFAVVAPGWYHGTLYRWRAEGGGGTWQPVGAKEMMLEGDDKVELVAVAPDDTLYAVVADYRNTCGYIPCVFGVVYRSTDDGETWQETPYGGGSYWPSVDALAVGPTGRVWIGGGNLGGAHWMSTSADAGATWTLSTVTPRIGDNYPGDHSSYDFAFDGQGNPYITTGGETMFLGVGTPEYPQGVYGSFDDGASWQRLTPADISVARLSIAVNGDADIYNSGYGGLVRSTDGGANWQALSFPVTYGPTYICDLAFDYSGRLWVATQTFGLGGVVNAGLYRSARPLGSGPTPPPGRGTTPPSGEQKPQEDLAPGSAMEMEVLNNMNVGAVYNDPACYPQFTIPQAYRITYIGTYHWNDGNGTSGDGTIGLLGDDGSVLGRWQVSSALPVYQAPAATWIVNPEITIPAGTYTILNSDPSTWSHNPESGGCGFSKVLGHPDTTSR